MPDSTALDVLALAAHPDDVELCAGGTVCLLARQGYRVGIVDFTRGELGSRGTPDLRVQEAAAAARILGLAARDNLGLPDGGIENTPANRLALIRLIRRYRPRIVLINPPVCRHPDHVHAAALSADTLYYSGLRKIETYDPDGAPDGNPDGTPQAPWRPGHVLHYMQTLPFDPTFVVDVSDVWPQRIEALLAFRSQFHHPDYEPAGDEPETFISNPDFFHSIEARARTYGQLIGATYGEPFLYRNGPVGVRDLVATLGHEKAFA